MTVQTPSRRALLTGATALSAIAVSSFAQPGGGKALAPSPSAETSFPDLEAGFIAAYGRFKHQFEADKEDRRRFKEAFFKQYGFQFYDEQEGEPVWLEKARKDFSKNWPSDDLDLKRWDLLNDETIPLALEILKQRPQNLADLALQAQATTLLNENLWLSIEESDWLPCESDFSLRMLVDNVLGLCGKRAMPGMNVLPAPDVNGSGSEDKDDAPPRQAKYRLLNSDLNPVFALLKKHSKAKILLGSAVAEQDELDILTNFGRSHTAETRRKRRNADRRVSRWSANERAEFYKLLELPPLSNVGESILVDYLRKEFATRAFDNTEELRFLLDSLYERTTPVWLHEKFPEGSSQTFRELENQRSI